MKRIALIGNSNVGKSTLFNTLTKSHQKVVNAPGTTVSVETGEWGEYELIDIPGLISFYHISPDEEVATNAIMHEDETLRPDVAILVADALHLSRALYLLAQVKASGLPIILAITMVDLAQKRGVALDKELIKEVSGVHEVVFLDARSGKGSVDLKKAVDSAPESGSLNTTDDPKAWAKEHAAEHFAWVEGAEQKLQLHRLEETATKHKIDKVLLNRFCGVGIFALIMFAVFWVTTTVAAPFIDFFDITLRDLLSSGEDGFWFLFYDNVILETVITVLTFLPPMFFMFISLAILEGSGYMARAAFVADRIMKAIGLDGRSLLPLIVGFGCNLPAVSGTRIISDSRSRRTLGYLIPFTLCSARLAVFVVLAHAFFPESAGLVVFLMYIISIVVIILVGMTIRIVKRDKYTTNPFIISLPPYQLPLVLPMLRSTGSKLMMFIKEAGTIIAIVITVLFMLQNVPLAGTKNIDGSDTHFADVDDIHNSYYGFVTDAVAPAFSPAGFGDWHFSSALITGFLAKEVVVASLANSYGIDSDALEDEENADADAEENAEPASQALGEQLASTLELSSGGHQVPAGIAFMVFILCYVPCLATAAALKREYGFKFAIKSACVSLSIAYVLAVLIFQIGSLFA
ncbi:MAG: ferrous iron transporter B [Candidatus Ancillula sp.]|jgi:ferrous iron transport protein B|nr:ferrous iron transporter B [Candidatus Ancillula sp.]